MRNYNTYIVVLCILFLGLRSAYSQQSPSLNTISQAGECSIQVLSSSESEVVISWKSFRAWTVREGKRSWIRHNAIKFAAPTDSASLPVLNLHVGIPADARNLQVTVTDQSLHQWTIETVGLRAIKLHGSNANAVLGTPFKRFGLRIVPVFLTPFISNGSSSKVLTDGVITIRWNQISNRKSTTVIGTENRSISSQLEQTVINYQLAKHWRTESKSTTVNNSLHAPSGVSVGKSVVLSNGNVGIQIVPASRFVQSGVSELIGSAINQLNLTNRGVEVPFRIADHNNNGVFDDQDTLIYYGKRNINEDQPFYYSQITDTNGYCLNWLNGSTLPLIKESDGKRTTSLECKYFDSTIHIEHENLYLGGLLDSLPFADITTLHKPEFTPSERFYWLKLQYNYVFREVKQMIFTCSPYYLNNDSIRIRIRVAGYGIMSRDSIRHRLSITLNTHNNLGIFDFRETADTLLEAVVPSSYLINGKNTLDVYLTPPPGVAEKDYKTQDVIYIDYLDLTGKWSTSSFDDIAVVRTPSQFNSPYRVSVIGSKEPLSYAISNSAFTHTDSVQQGFVFRMSSRQFDPSKRINPGLVVNFGDSVASCGDYGSGFYIMEMDGVTGQPLRKELITCFPDPVTTNAFQKMVAFINATKNGNIILAGLSVSAGTNVLSNELRDALIALGSTAALRTDWFVASWTFATKKGDPKTTQERFASYGENSNGVVMNAFFPSVNGKEFRSVVTLDGNPGEEVVLSSTFNPALRYHAVDSLLDPANSADLIIISHPAFIQEANRLAAHRRIHDSLKVAVVDVYRVYDEFGHGIKSPNAIRAFLQYADQQWTSPKPRYVLLFGNASWDPQQRFPTSTEYPDYIPTIMNPVADFMFTIGSDNDVLSPKQAIGRLSVLTPEDARAVVDKLIDYDEQPPGPWNKRFVFIAGGYNAIEASQLSASDIRISNRYIAGPNFGGDPTLITRQNFDNFEVDGVRARAELSKGAFWVSFTGHGSTGVVDVDYGYPEDIDNGNKYFILTTWSCQTGAFAEPGIIVRNERHVNYPGKAAIAATGSTSFSPIDVDEAIKDQLYTDMTFNHIREIGWLLMNAKLKMFEYKSQLGAYDSTRGRNSLLTYSLLGDPSMKVIARSTPELGFQNIQLLNKVGKAPTIDDSVVSITADLWNYGRPIDQFKPDSLITVVGIIVYSDRSEYRDTVRVIGLNSTTPVKLTLPLEHKPGAYTVRLEVDPEYRFKTETYRIDNIESRTLLIQGNKPLLIEPLPYGKVSSYDGVTIRLLNPPSGPGANIEVDTVPAFNSPALFNNGSRGVTTNAELTTTWTFSMPQQLRSASTFWWRAVATSGDTSVAQLFPLVQTFTVDTTISNGTEYILRGVNQMNDATLSNLANTQSGVGPGTRRIPIYVKSIGQTYLSTGELIPEKKIYIIVDNKEYRIHERDGINLLVLKPETTIPYSDNAFAFYKTDDQTRFLDFVRDSIPIGYRVILGASGVSFMGKNDTSAVARQIRDAFKTLGSTLIDTMNQADSYVLIGGKGITNIIERRISNDSMFAAGMSPPFPVSAVDTFLAISQAGSIALPEVGPAVTWNRVNLNYSGNVPLDITVYGIKRDGVRDSVLHGVTRSTLDLSSINVAQYPKLDFVANFQNDTTQRLRSFNVEFDPSPELAIVPSTFRMERDSVLQGDTAYLNATIINLSRVYPAGNIHSKLSFSQPGNTNLIDSAVTGSILPNDSVSLTLSIPTDLIKGSRLFTFVTNPTDNPAELYRQNNTLSGQMKVGSDTINPSVIVYADNQRLMNGDYVTPKPKFEIRIYDNSHLHLVDTLTLKLVLDNDFIVASNPGASFRQLSAGPNDQQAVFTYVPPVALKNGRHDLRIYTSDATGNGDTTDLISFYVDRSLRVDKVVNVPNPFVRKTTFTFMIGGESQPTSGEISVFTVAGRKIKTIKLSAADLHVGFNKLEWDGRDEDGDELANGTYLYRLTIHDSDEKQEVIEKLVRMR